MITEWHPMMSPVARAARWVLPVAVSGTVLAFLLTRIDARTVIDHLTADVLAVFVPALLLFAVVSLCIEGVSLDRLISPPNHLPNSWTCARVKAASYPLGLIHFALGATTLTVLLGRRMGIAVAIAAGAVMMIALLDLGILLALTALGATLFSEQVPALRVGVVAAATLALAGGFAVLRIPATLGPLERIRSSAFLRTARAAPTSLLAEVALWRVFFISSCIYLVWTALFAFGISVPLGDLVINIAALALVSALPIAAAGIGTGQLAFVYLFRAWGEPGQLLACSLMLSGGLIVMRVALGLLFVREFAEEPLDLARGSG